jgi:hypothetical protein
VLECGIDKNTTIVIDYSPTTLVSALVVEPSNRHQVVAIDLKWTEAKV